MAAHAAAVVRVTGHACILVDMPFGSYQESPSQAFASAARMLAASGADGVKLEGGAALAPTTRFLVERGVPVLAHVGLMPQYKNTMGGFKAQGMTDVAVVRMPQRKGWRRVGRESVRGVRSRRGPSVCKKENTKNN